MSAVVRPVEQAFEHLGQIREHLTALDELADTIGDVDLARHVGSAMSVNTAALTRVTVLLQTVRETTGSDDVDLDSQHVAGARGV